MAATPRPHAKTSRQDAAGGGLPAKRLTGRPVIVVVGASEGGLSLMARALHALGVDMLESDAVDPWSGNGTDHRRAWVSDLNSRLLASIDRAPDSPAHALPFPAGWWRRPVAQAIRREMAQALETALSDHTESWGFADLATARLLPVWQEVFDQLGLAPVYVWALTHPAQVLSRGSRKKLEASEIRWFAYSADIFRYAGERLAAVVDEDDWRADPQALIEQLSDKLQMRWRGTRLDLYETLSALLEDEAERDEATRRPVLPLAAAFHAAARRIDHDPDARARTAAIADSAELLRPMVAAFLAAAPAAAATGPGAAHAPDNEEAVRLRQEIEDLRRASAARTEGTHEVTVDNRVAALEVELEAKEAETRWLHDQYRDRLHEAEAEIEALRDRAGGPGGLGDAGSAAGTEAELSAAHAEIQRLQSEMTNLNNANERYLARIYELRKSLEDQGGSRGFG